MKTIRNYVYAAMLAASAFTLLPNVASAQEPAHGKFTLTHDVRWQSATVPAGEYEFTFNPEGPTRLLSLNKVSGTPAAYMLLVPSADEARTTGANRLVLESTPEGSYVSAMQLPEFGEALYFNVPAHAAVKTIAKAEATAAGAAR